MSEMLFIELGTEELPPKSLTSLAQALLDNVSNQLDGAGLSYESPTWFASPRRMALRFENVPEATASKQVTKKGPPVRAAYDAEGNPTKAGEGFARGLGVDVKDCYVLETDKGDYIAYDQTEPPLTLEANIAGWVSQALSKLPIPKMMRWGDKAYAFVRPVHWLLMCHGDKLLPGEVLGLSAGMQTFGHRFHHPEAVTLSHAREYEAVLENAFVMVDHAKRRRKIVERARDLAKEKGLEVSMNDDLLDEVASINEWPVPLCCDFDPRFLAAPKEALMAAMEEHQKCFPMCDAKGQCAPHFITVSNIDSRDMAVVKAGNERVMSARLSDALFFYEQDCEKGFAARRDALKNVTFHQKLGSVFDRTERLSALAGYIAGKLASDAQAAAHAGLLSKIDLLTDMVGEFPALQGVMGRYYAQAEGISETIAQAIEAQYWPKGAGGELPEHPVASAVALAEKCDVLVGIFSTGERPTGVKDPFALRRAAIGVLRICIETPCALDILDILTHAAGLYQVSDTVATDVWEYMLDRLRVYYADRGVPKDVIESVIANGVTHSHELDKRIAAVQHFKTLPESSELAAVNKRVQNILSKASSPEVDIDSALFNHDAENVLFQSLQTMQKEAQQRIVSGDYTGFFQLLAGLREPLDAYFESVMVMDEDQTIQNNRVAMLRDLQATLGSLADLSLLQ